MLSGEVFLQQVRGNRLVWAGGMYGSGKTALAVRIGYEFVKRGWAKHIVTNFPCVLATPISDIPARDAFVILDEGGVFLKAPEFDEYSAYLRKTNLTLFVASKNEVPSKAKSLLVVRSFNGHSFGVPFWRYTAHWNGIVFKEKASLFWWRPSEVFGLYDTEYPSGDDWGISDWIRREFPKRDSSGLAEVDQLGGYIKEFAAAASEFSGAVSLSQGKRTRSRH